jgi:hypothetical protein
MISEGYVSSILCQTFQTDERSWYNERNQELLFQVNAERPAADEWYVPTKD